ncbi:hypothetical protein BASA83_009743 [Batrachochytrium salamandrivorans]|nr:hypothetical protein BASA83_009743 [Batrachochytrium salamandrivorans]
MARRFHRSRLLRSPVDKPGLAIITTDLASPAQLSNDHVSSNKPPTDKPETKQRTEQGSIFISALNTLMQTRTFSSIASRAGDTASPSPISGHDPSARSDSVSSSYAPTSLDDFPKRNKWPASSKRHQ